MLPVLAAVATLALYQGETDTTVAVRQGQRLEVSDFGGDVVIKTWRQNSVRIKATHSSRDHVNISTAGGVVTIGASGRHGPANVDYEILAPVWMPLSISGSPSAEVTIEGTQAEVSVETVEGSIRVEGGDGNISLRTVEGSITVEGANGHLELNTVDGSIEVKGCSGDLSLDTVDGDIKLIDITSANVDASTVDGSIEYVGTIKDAGRYRLTSHDGDVSIAVPENTNATFSVSYFDGDFDSCFPVTLKDQQSKRRFRFQLGSGSAQVELESFSGHIKMCRPGQMEDHDDEKE
jgi:DUF4097 and DUF4098 domain-containing protein YvlB